MDSLVLTQTASALKREFGVTISFRQLLERIPTPNHLYEFLAGELPGWGGTGSKDTSDSDKLQRSCEVVPASTQVAAPAAKKTFGAGARVNLNDIQLSAPQQQALDIFVDNYTGKSPRSKQFAQQHRQYMADPRTVSGFRPSLKEITYPIVAERSKGGYIWDLDGNKYIDVTSGFGPATSMSITASAG